MIHIQTRQRRRERGISDDLIRCSKCDEPNDRAPQRYCGACHAVYMRGWRAKPSHLSHETFCSTLRGIDA